MPRSRRLVPPLVLLMIAGALAGSSARFANAETPEISAGRPNLILILTDDQALSTLGSMPLTLALLGTQGATFSNHFVPLSLCCPSRSTILTGLHVHNHKVVTNYPPSGGYERFDALGHERRTLAVALQDAGYRTALFGKYLNGYPNGEDRSHVPEGWDEWASPVQGSPYAEYRYTLNENGRLVRYDNKPEAYMTDVLAGKAVDFVRRASASGQPFFLYLSTYAPHKPAVPARRHVGLFRGVKAPRTPSFNEPDVRDKPKSIRQSPPLSAGKVGAIDTLYRKQLQTLQAVDEAVAAVVEALRTAGRLDDTYVVFTSDNGFHMGEHRLEPGKYTAYEPDIHVPLLVRGPGVPAGLKVTRLTSSVDLAATFADLAGAALPVDPDGRSLAPLLRGESPAVWRQGVFLEQYPVSPGKPTNGILEPEDNASAHPSHRGLRTEAFKYVEYGTHEREVYDLRTDPDELTNLANRMPQSWLDSLSATVKALASCKGASCREIEARPVPALPAGR